ncbi:MAG: GlxA family transcriptional regulator [Chloroflexota bacterium]
MAKQGIVKSQLQPIQIGLLLLPAFNSMALNAFVDPFRAANYLQGQPLYQWHFLSLSSQAVTASNGLTISQTIPFPESTDTFDLIVVNASWTPENFQDQTLQHWLRSQSRRGALLVGIDTGAFVLAYAGLMDGYRATTHYEHLPSFRELFPKIQTAESLFVIDRDRLSSSGGMAAADLSLELIRLQNGMALSTAVGRYIFHERRRGGDEKQLSHTHAPIDPILPDVLREVLLVMEQNLEEAIPMPLLANRVGVSQRQLERIFKKHLGITPKRYYLNLRLIRGRALLTQTQLTIAEVAGACGFKSSEHFTRSYVKFFNMAPSRDRQEGRIPFQFWLYPESRSG